jgi:hypothetical protein
VLPPPLHLAVPVDDDVLLGELPLGRPEDRRLGYDGGEGQGQRYRALIIYGHGGATRAARAVEATAGARALACGQRRGGRGRGDHHAEELAKIPEGVVLALEVLGRRDEGVEGAARARLVAARVRRRRGRRHLQRVHQINGARNGELRHARGRRRRRCWRPGDGGGRRRGQQLRSLHRSRFALQRRTIVILIVYFALKPLRFPFNFPSISLQFPFNLPLNIQNRKQSIIRTNETNVKNISTQWYLTLGRLRYPKLSMPISI